MSGASRKSNLPDGMLTPFTKMTRLEKVAAGGFGEVYKAEHADWGTVAYKKLPQSFIQPNDRSVRQMMREVEILKTLRHQNIVTITGIVFENGNYGIVLEFMFHGNADNFFVTFLVPLPWKVQLVHDVVLGMNYLHTLSQPIIHGDLKIQNVLVTGGYQAKISDFGLSSWKGMSKSSSRQTDIAGTVTHISPERWKDVNIHPTEKEDIYAFGVLVWEMFTERKPFPNLSNAIAIMLAVSNGQRPDVKLLPSDTPSLIQSTIETSWTTNPVDRKSFKDIKVDFDNYISTHAEEIKMAKHDLHRQESSSDSLIHLDGLSLTSDAVNQNLSMQRRHSGGYTGNDQTINHHQTTACISERPVAKPSAANSCVQVNDPVRILDPCHAEPSQSGKVPDESKPTVSSFLPPLSLCLDDNHNLMDLNLPVDSRFKIAYPIEESEGKASVMQTALTFEPNVPQGQGLISLQTNSSSLSCRPPDETAEVSETLVKDLFIPLHAFTTEDRDLTSLPSNLPFCIEGEQSVIGNRVCVDLHSQQISTREQELGISSSHQRLDFVEENLDTVMNRPMSVPETDATLTTPESEPQDKAQQPNDLSNSLPRNDQSNSSKDNWEKSNDLLKIDLKNWNKNTEYNNPYANKGYFPKDGGSFKEHAAQLPMSTFQNLSCPSGGSRDEAPAQGHHQQQLPRCEGNGRSESPNSFHRDPSGNNRHILNNGRSSITWRKDGKEVTIVNSNSVGPYVQFGDNNTMHITTSVHPSSSASSVSKLQQNPLLRSKEPAKKEKIIVPDRLVDTDVIQIVADDIARDWTRLARELGVRDSDIGRYEIDNHVHGVIEIAYQMLRDWVEKKGVDAKLQLLAKALVAIKRPDVALKLSSSALAARQK